MTGVLRAQARTGMAGMTGLDAPACLALLVARGVREDIAALFLPYWEAGMLEAAEEHREQSAHEQT